MLARLNARLVALREALIDPPRSARTGGKAALWAALSLAALAVVAPRFTLFERLELATQDIRFQRRGPRTSRARVVVIAVDDATVAAWSDRPMAFWGDRYARLIRNARAAGATQVALDIIPATQSEEYVQMLLSRALEQARAKARSNGGVGLGDAEIEAILNAPDTPELTPDRALRDAVQSADGHITLANNATRELLIPQLAGLDGMKCGPYIGFVDLPDQTDDAVRVAALFARTPKNARNNGITPSLAALVAARAAGLHPDRADDLHRLVQKRSTTRAEPGGALETFWLNPPYGAGGTPPIISAALLADDPGALPPRERALLHGAIAVIGVTQSQTNDVYRAPGGTRANIPGVVFHAYAISTLLDGAALARLSWWREGLFSFALTLCWVGLARGANLSFVPGLLLAVTFASLWGAASFFFFVQARLLLPVAAPTLFVIVAALLTYGVSAAEERRARGRVEKIFGRNVSPQIRDYLIRQDAAGRLQQGQMAEASVLFFDVRGSTAFAENRPPEEVIAALNQLYTATVPLVEAQGGLVNRFLGDGFLALFGAPQPMPDHARAAAETALRIAALLEANEASARANAPAGETSSLRLSGGCGVHSGPVVYGYLGARDRAEFTVIGDTVNLAARLESLNRTLGTVAVLSEATVAPLSDDLRARFDGPIECAVAGRLAKAHVYTLRLGSAPASVLNSPLPTTQSPQL